MIRHSVSDGLYLRAAGSGTRHLCFVHGLGESGLCFEEILARPELDTWHRFAPDLPGYGKTPWLAEPLSLAETADALARWIASSGYPSPVLVGHAMGGVIGLLLCERHPDLVRAFVNVEGNVSPADCAFSARAALLAPTEFREHGMNVLLDELYHAGEQDRAIRGYYTSIRLCDPRSFYLHSRQIVQMSSVLDLAKRMGQLRVPKWYVAGLPRGVGAETRDLLTEAGVPCLSVANAGHWPFVDQPGPFATRLLSLLEQVDSPSEPS